MTAKAQWVLDAEALCSKEGHPDVVDDHCVRCVVSVPRSSSPQTYPGQLDRLVSPRPRNCKQWRRDQGCPLHGDPCFPANL